MFSGKYARPASVLFAMKRQGKSLHLEHVKNHPSRWYLNDGTPICARTAEEVIRDPRVIDCGGGLFEDVPGQVFRYAGGGE
jgi:hypothetical protein